MTMIREKIRKMKTMKRKRRCALLILELSVYMFIVHN